MFKIKKNYGIYIHIPFCRNKCDYCNFYSISVNNADIIESYVNVLIKEIDYISEINGPVSADTVYFGGGTPSILKPEQAGKIIKRISEKFALCSDPEITLEMNPDDLHEEKLKGFIDAGINRIVLGVQSLDDGMRSVIGRRGKAPGSSELDLFFKYGNFTRCIDIIAGLPGQSESQLLKDLGSVVCYKPEHISLYLLSIEEGTPLGRRFIPDEKFEDHQADIWGKAMDFLDEKGYIHYEISNYALPGFESRHNSKYWDFTPFYGLGSGAHSYAGGKRYSNGVSVNEYIKCSNFSYEFDIASDDAIVVEFIMTALRRMNGFSGEEFTAVTGRILPSDILAKLKILNEEGKIEIKNGRYYLTKSGLYIADSIIYNLAENFL